LRRAASSRRCRWRSSSPLSSASSSARTAGSASVSASWSALRFIHASTSVTSVAHAKLWAHAQHASSTAAVLGAGVENDGDAETDGHPSAPFDDGERPGWSAGRAAPHVATAPSPSRRFGVRHRNDGIGVDAVAVQPAAFGQLDAERRVQAAVALARCVQQQRPAAALGVAAHARQPVVEPEVEAGQAISDGTHPLSMAGARSPTAPYSQ
jgi:hypothetical protein